MPRLRRPLTALATLAAGGALAACRTPRPPALWLERGAEPVRLAFDARALAALRVDGGAGRVRVTAADPARGDSVRVRVRVGKAEARLGA